MKILYMAMESSNWVINLCNEIAKLGNEVTCVVQMGDDYDRNNIPYSHDNLKIIRLTFDDFVDRNKIISNLLPQLEDDYDLVFGSHCHVSPVLSHVGNTLKVPWGAMLLDIPTDLIEQQPERARNWEFWFKVLDRATTMVFNTHVARDEYAKFTGKYFEDSNIVTYGISTPKELKMFGAKSNWPFVVSACRLTPVKNCKIIPKALDVCMEKKINKYIAIGRDSGELNLIKTLCEQTNTEFLHLQEISEVVKLRTICNATALIYPQTTEYIGGLSPFEAMYVGTPAVVPDLKVMRDLYGDHAIYFRNNDIVDLSRVLDELITNPPTQEWLQAASDYAEEVASYRSMAKGLNDIFINMKNTYKSEV